MGTKRKYQDKEIETSPFSVEHYHELLNNPRAFEPRTGWHSPFSAIAIGASGGAFLADPAGGEDHFWRPSRDRRLGKNFVTYVAPKHHRSCSCCGSTACLSLTSRQEVCA